MKMTIKLFDDLSLSAMKKQQVLPIDRPFIFSIYNDDTGAILFPGRLMQP
jgi:serine protease inhibitor